MANRGPLLGVGALVGVLVLGTVVGAVAGVGPLARSTPPDQVTDPEEMLARSLQSVIDANVGPPRGDRRRHVPGALLGRPEASVELDGTQAEGDIRPKDAKTRAHVVEIAALGVDLETVTVWDGAWYRTGPDEPWQRVSLGGVASEAGRRHQPAHARRPPSWLPRPARHRADGDRRGVCRAVGSLPPRRPRRGHGPLRRSSGSCCPTTARPRCRPLEHDRDARHGCRDAAAGPPRDRHGQRRRLGRPAPGRRR